MIRPLSLLIIILLLCTAVTGSLHLHADGVYHADCSVCVGAQQQGDSVSVPPVVAVHVQFTRTSFPLPLLTASVRNCFAPANNRAPPA